MMFTAQKCCDLLSSVTTRPVILIVDGIDQVSVLSSLSINCVILSYVCYITLNSDHLLWLLANVC